MNDKKESFINKHFVLLTGVISLVLFLIAATMVVLAVRDTQWPPLIKANPAFSDLSRRQAKQGPCAFGNPSKEKCSFDTFEFDEREVSFSTGAEVLPKMLNGTLTVPKSDGPRPAIVLIAGSGPLGRDAESPGDLVSKLRPPLLLMKELAHHLAKRGFVVLRYDKRTCQKCYADVYQKASSENVDLLARFSFLHFLDDAQSALAFLRTQDGVDAEHTLALGHSQGAAFLPALYEREPDLKALVWLAGFTGSFEDTLITQLDTFADIRRSQFDFLGAYMAQKQKEAFEVCFADEKQNKDEQCLGGGVRQGALFEYNRFTKSTLDKLSKVKAPTFLAQGNVERNVRPETLDELRRSRSLKDAEFHLLDGLNHSFVNVLKGEAHLSPTLLQALDKFLLSLD